MSAASTPVAPATSRAAKAILVGGLACGVLDITAAFVTFGLRGASPVRILQSIAGGLLGPASFSGGAATAALGLAIHFLIAFTAATVFYAASRKLAFLTERAVLWGFTYGVMVYLFMYWVVQPLSAQRRGPFVITAHVIAIVTHMFCVGLPISLAVRRYSR